MTTYILCEGESDARLIERLLPEALMMEAKVFPAGGLYAVNSLARSLIVRRQCPVAIVVDADEIRPNRVEQRRSEIEEILERVAIDAPVKVVLAVPEMEIIFFQDRSLLSSLVGYEVPQDTFNAAQYEPKQILMELMSQSERFNHGSELIERLTTEDLHILRKAPVIQELVQFLQSVRSERETVEAV
ncbi:MAG: hypothetical protein ACO31I_14430 [Prochlorotrichaceae cyanobacterium]|jgi:hypothetical protein